MNGESNQNQAKSQTPDNQNNTGNINNQTKQGNSVVPSAQANRNRAVQQQRKPQPPSPPNGGGNINANINNRPKTAPPAVKNANMADKTFDSGATRTFDTNRDIDIKPSQPRREGQQTRVGSSAGRNASSDGTYHMTGGTIKSSRQRVTNSASSRDDSGGVSISSINKKKNKSNDAASDTKKSGFIMSGIFKVVIYIVGVVAVSVFFAYNIIMIANDVFAFVKSPVAATVTIPENADIEEIGQILYDNKLIKYPKIFNFYETYKKKDKVWEFAAGTYPVSSLLNYDEFINEFIVKAAARQVVTVTIPEGFTIDQIIDLFVVTNGMGTRDKFIDVINNVDFSQYGYRFLKPLYENKANLSPDRKYLLEGYLFPNTYDFYKDESEINIIIKLLDGFNVQFNEDCYKKVEILDKQYYDTIGRHFTIDDAVILASMVQREAKFPSDFVKISAVFHNRLQYSASFPYLQSDATIMYSYGYNKADLTQADLQENLPYNTYTNKGLPPSAICNPGYEAIFAALWPDEEMLSNYFYFIAELDGTVTYSQTAAQHEAAKARISSERAAAATAAPAQ